MDTLARLRLKPLGVWTTPWQADSLLGAVACSWARSHGAHALRRDLLDPWRGGEPPFVISDAFPGVAMPVPAAVPLWWEWAPAERKAVKKQRWTTASGFRRIQRHERPELEDAPFLIHDRVRLRNSISRATDTTAAGGELFEVPYSRLSDPDGHLAIYVRASGRGMDILLQALTMLGRTGYGADSSVGHGSFELDDSPLSCAELDDVPGADGFVSLSTYQPAASDPTDGFWRAFIKYGKLAPDFHDKADFKRPQIMLEAGACFHTGGRPKPFYGGPIEADRLLDPASRIALAELDVHPLQAAFGLAVPLQWSPADERTAPVAGGADRYASNDRTRQR